MLHRFFTKRITIFLILLTAILASLFFIWFSELERSPTPLTNIEPEITTPIISETQKIERKKEIRIERERASDALLSSDTKRERALLLAKKADYLALNSEYHDALEIYERVIALSPLDEYKKKAAAIAFEARVFTKSIEWYTETQ